MIELREVIETDLKVFYENQTDPEALAMAKFASRDRDAHIASWRRIQADPTCIARTVLLDGQVAGYIGSWLADDRRLVGYWIGREFWGRGIATTAVRALVADVSDRPLYAWVATSNVASARVLEKAGFVLDSPEPVVGEDGVEESLYRLP